MAQPTQLTPTEQDALVKQIGLAMLRVAPEDWEQLTVDYRAVGRYAEATGQVVYTDGATEPWTLPPDLQGLFARLRGGMYREGRGTWYNARYKLDHPSSYNLEYDREEPVWDLPPPPQAYPDDMRIFPRTDDNVPEWLRRRLAVAPPAPVGPPTPRFRVARIFDGPGEDGRPSVNRPPIDEVDLPELLDYLDGAPLVGPARGYDVDRLDPEGRQSVPVAFHTDGIWIWPAAVNYYLREHDIAAEPDLVEHIRRMRFRLPQVDEPTRSAAQVFLGPPPAPAPPPRPAPTRALPVAPPRAPAAPPPAALPSQGPPGRSVDQLRTRLVDLGVPESAYRIGPPAGRAWTMEQTDEGWRVGWYDREFVAPAMFEDVADASAFLLGKLMLDADRWGGEPAAERHAPRGTDFGGTRPPGTDPADLGADPAADPGLDFGASHRPRATAYGADPDFDPGLEPDFDLGADRRTHAAADPGLEFAADAAPNHGDRRPTRAADPGIEFGADRTTRTTDPGLDFDRTTSDPNPDRRPTRAADPGIDFGADRTTRTTDPNPDRHTHAAADPGIEFAEPGPNHGDRRPTRAADPGMEFDRTTRTFATDRGDRTTPYATDPGERDPDRGSDLRSPRPDHARAEHGADPDTDLEFEPMSAPLENFEPPAPLPAPLPPPAPPAPPPVEPTRTMAMEPPGPAHREPTRREPATMLQQRSATTAASGSEWPITPLPGEPPLTLFRGKRLMELEPGIEIDRFGDDDGNLVYAVGTPFPERSLVPEWVDRPYHAYRVRQPVQVLAGAAIPWFDQPGGGTAYLLPDAVGELVAHGQLVELDDRDRPRG